ncbi:DUF4286 family protein [Niabella hibiscisoli]|uniref:DUF4286 family protein n=1 Tax=Niabella hibiscisoli TaxID=1825928 RepID=UPI001F0FE7F3|nr:DUF4286 family protein [Niabella hibiscisoli]MCH5715253.1 DUF4286 family protein [Niabella hibiscisoli]
MELNTALIYNITNKVSHHIHSEWLAWMKTHHIPAVLATGCFLKAVLLRLKGVDDEEGPTYAVQYHAASEADYERYLSDFSTGLRQESLNKWGDQFIAFRTIMEVVN